MCGSFSGKPTATNASTVKILLYSNAQAPIDANFNCFTGEIE